MKVIRFYEHFINWIHSKTTNQQFLIFSAILVGISAGLAAVLLKLLVHYIFIGVTHDYNFRFQYSLYLVLPLIGIVVTVIISKYLFKGKLGKGTANILKAIIKNSASLPKNQTYSHILTSAVTVGFGGSAGLESPIVSTGSAIGSNYGKTYHVAYKERVLLLACGAAAGIAGAFNSPIAGVLFSLEVLMVDVTISAFIPLIIAAAAGALCSKIILQESILLSFKLKQPFDYHNVPYYIILSLLAALVSVYYARMYTVIEKLFQKRKKKVYQNAVIGGLLLAILIFLFPTLFGEGYESIKLIASGNPEKILDNSILSVFADNTWFILAFVGITMLAKVIAASTTINSGGNGGNFAPSLFVGAYLGYFFSRTINLFGWSRLPESNFTIVGMAGVLAGVFYAPLTGIFLIAEITGGYDLMIPLMIVASLSFVVVKYFEPLSMDAKKLAKKAHILTQNKDTTVLSSLKISRLIETDFHCIKPSLTLGEFISIIAQSKRNIFPVVNDENELLGMVYLDDIRETIFKTELYDKVTVRNLMKKEDNVINEGDDMHIVMKKFDDTGAWNLAVVEGKKYIGIISKSGVLTKYRRQLVRTP